MERIQKAYQDFARNFYRDNYRYSISIDSLLPTLVVYDIITLDERAMIENQVTPTDKSLLLFLHIMPYKDLDCHRALVRVLERRNEPEHAKFLSDRIFLLDSDTNADYGSAVAAHEAQVEVAGSKAILKATDFTKEKDWKYLAQGVSGKVFEATFKQNRQVAIKKIQATINNESDCKLEAELLRQADHPHIVKLLGVVDNSVVGEVWIITELLNGGSLRPYCTGNLCHHFDHVQKTEIGSHCWSALSYLYDCANITHKDVKPDNILIHKMSDGRLVAKLCDFGLAEIKATMVSTKTQGKSGTWMYFPPEFAESIRNPRKADVYSMGATLCELFINKYFWHHLDNGEPLDRFQVACELSMVKFRQINAAASASTEETRFGPGATALDHCDNCPPPIKNILKLAVSFDRQDRPSASDTLKVFQDVFSSF